MQEQEIDSVTPTASAGYASGLFFLVWAMIGWVGILSNDPLIATLSMPGLDPGPAILPIFSTAFLTLGGVYFLVNGWIRRRSGLDSFQLREVAIPAVFLISAIALVFWVSYSGFTLPAFCFATLWLALLASKSSTIWKRLAVAALVSAAIIGGIELVFAELLRVPLP